MSLDLAEYLDNAREDQKQRLPIEKCPDADAYLEFTVRSTLISTVSGSDTMSMMSGFDNMSIDSGPDTDFRFGDNSSMAQGVPGQKDAGADNVDASQTPNVQSKRFA